MCCSHPAARCESSGFPAPWNLSVVIPGRATDLGFSRDRQSQLPKSAKADLGGASPESIITGSGYGFRAPSLRSGPEGLAHLNRNALQPGDPLVVATAACSKVSIA